MDDLKRLVEEEEARIYLDSDILEVRTSLAQLVDDIDENKRRKENLAKQFKFKLTSSLNLEKNESLLKKATSNYFEAIQKGLDKPITFINELIKTNRISFQYRNLDKLSKDEICDIIKDQNLIEIIEMLENE